MKPCYPLFPQEHVTIHPLFRRGVKRCATVYCLSFSQDSHFLVLSSNTETIHVFRFDEEQQGQQQHQQELQRQAQAANAG